MKVVIVYPVINPFTYEMDCFYLDYGCGYPERFELYNDEWEGGTVPFIGY